MKGIISFECHRRATPTRTIAINFSTHAALMADLETRLTARQGFAVATLNLDHVVKLRRFEAFRAAYLRHSHVVADGNPVVWLHRLAGRPVELVPGSELIQPLAALAAQLGVPIALLGGRMETLDFAAERLAATHPNLQIAAKIAPPFGFDPDGPGAVVCLDELAASGARLCFLALGAPKQEIFATHGLTRLPDCGFVSIGAGLDFVAGHQRRAPKWVQKMAMEWAWRMASDPRRLARRYLDCALILPGLGLAALRARVTRRSRGQPQG